MLHHSLFKKLSLLAAAFMLAGALLSFARGAWMFGLGVCVGSAWLFLNSYFLFRLIQIGFEPKVRMSDRILLFSILKFPVLYVAGFFILKTRVFPAYGIVTGLTLYIFAFIATWVRFSMEAKPSGPAGERL